MPIGSVSHVSQGSSFVQAPQWLKALDLKIVGLAVGILCALAIAVMTIRSLYARWKNSGQTTDSVLPTSGILPISTTNTSADAAPSSTATSSGTTAAVSSSVASSTTATTLTTAPSQSGTISAVEPKSKLEVAVETVIQECQRQKNENCKNSGTSMVICTFQWGEFPYEIESMNFSELQNKLPTWLKEKAGSNQWFDLGVEANVVVMATNRYKMLTLEIN